MKKFVFGLVSLFVLGGCPGEEERTYDLVDGSGSGVTGIVTLRQTSGKSGLGETRWHFEASDPMNRELVGWVHEGRCAELGGIVHTAPFANGARSAQYTGVTGNGPIGGQTIGAYEDDYAFAVYEGSTELTAPPPSVLACADL